MKKQIIKFLTGFFILPTILAVVWGLLWLGEHHPNVCGSALLIGFSILSGLFALMAPEDDGNY